MKLEIRVGGSINGEEIVLGTSFSTIDSIRLTSYFVYLLNAKSYHSEFKSFREKIEGNQIHFAISSPYFVLSNGDVYLPVTSAFYNWLNRFYKPEEKISKKKYKRYIPLLKLNETADINEFIKNYIEVEEKIRIIEEFRIRNYVNRNTGKSENVYSIKTSIVQPFNFLILTNWERQDLIKSCIFSNDSIHFLGKRVSIGLGKVKFYYCDNTIDENILVCGEEKGEGYYYLFNRIPVNEKLLKNVDLKKSYYEIVKVKGYLPSNKGRLVGRCLICFKEGSVFYLKSTKFENYCYQINSTNAKEYFLPITPILIRLGDRS